MAEPSTANEQFLQSKWGPMPVWVWALLGLVAAYVYNKYKANQQAQTAAAASAATTATTGQAQGQAVSPQFVIEENQAPSYNVQTVTGVTGPQGPQGPQGPTGPTGPTGPSGPIMVGHPIPAPTPTPPVSTPPSPTPPPRPKAPIEYRVPQGSGESYSSIAKKFGYKPGGMALYYYNITSSPHSALAKQEMKARGPNLLYGNELVYVPQS